MWTRLIQKGPMPVNKSLLHLGAALAIAAPLAGAADRHASAPAATAAQQITPAGTQASTYGPAENFTGRVRVDPLFTANQSTNASGAYVSFEPGAHSAWHTHPAGQRLVVTSGIGLTQEWGKPVQIIRQGDVVWCPPGVKHWHGATPESAMTHMAIGTAVDGKSVTWMEKVSDEQYKAR
jgi:quercetin dioxygenase-like cupin family protein